MPFGDALTKIVAALRDPYLLFGLGAGIILVGALTTTGNAVLVLIVAIVLVVALVARLIANVQSQPRPDRISMDINAQGAVIEHSDVGVVHGLPTGQITLKPNVANAHVRTSHVATVGDQAQSSGEGAPKHVDDRLSGG